MCVCLECTGIVIRFEQFLFEFLFVLETSQTIHRLKVDKVNLRYRIYSE